MSETELLRENCVDSDAERDREGSNGLDTWSRTFAALDESGVSLCETGLAVELAGCPPTLLSQFPDLRPDLHDNNTYHGN